MELGQIPNTEFAVNIEISTLITLFTKVEMANLPQLNTYSHGVQSFAEPAKNIMM